MKLTKTQIDYFTERLKAKRDAFVKGHNIGERPNVPDYSDEQKLAMIAAGQAVLIDPSRNHYGYITKAFKYPHDELKAAVQAQLDAYNMRLSEVTKEADRLQEQAMDRLMFAADGGVLTEILENAFK